MENLKDKLINWKGDKVLMTIFPHPDDETMTSAGLLMTAKELGWKTIVVTLTKGEAGKLYTNGKGMSLKEIRTNELTNAVKILGVDYLELGDFGDALLRNNKSDWIRWIEKLINEYKPSLVVSYDHTGISGHPDHIVLSVELFKLLKKYKRRITLLWFTLPENLRKYSYNKKLIKFASKPKLILNIGGKWWKKYLAVKAHKSQNMGKDFPVPIIFVLAIYHYEWYHKVDLGKRYPYTFVDFEL